MGRIETASQARVKQVFFFLSRCCTYGFFELRRGRNVAFARSPEVTKVFFPCHGNPEFFANFRRLYEVELL